MVIRSHAKSDDFPAHQQDKSIDMSDHLISIFLVIESAFWINIKELYIVFFSNNCTLFLMHHSLCLCEAKAQEALLNPWRHSCKAAKPPLLHRNGNSVRLFMLRPGSPIITIYYQHILPWLDLKSVNKCHWYTPCVQIFSRVTHRLYSNSLCGGLIKKIPYIPGIKCD